LIDFCNFLIKAKFTQKDAIETKLEVLPILVLGSFGPYGGVIYDPIYCKDSNGNSYLYQRKSNKQHLRERLGDSKCCGLCYGRAI